MTYNIKPEMDTRNLFNYKCHTCKHTKEPDEFGYNTQTKTKRVTCNVCHGKRSERAATLRTSRLETQSNVYFPTPEVVHILSDTTEEEAPPRVVFHIPLGTSEEEPVCENACSNRLECCAVRARFTCLHLQCVRTHLMLGRCIACSCSTLRYDREVELSNGASSSGPAIREDEAEPEEEVEPGDCLDTLSLFVTEHP